MRISVVPHLVAVGLAFCMVLMPFEGSKASSSLVQGASLVPVVDTRNEEVAGVLALYSKTERFTGEIPGPAEPKNIFVDFMQAGQYEANAPVPNNLLVLKESLVSAPALFVLGPVQIRSVSKISGNKYLIKGSVDQGDCVSRSMFVEKSITVEISLTGSGVGKDGAPAGLVPKYLDISEKEVACSK